MKTYDKLVRDRIPEIIEGRGGKAAFRTVEAAEYLTRLADKLREEAAEFAEKPSQEELADVLEVVRALMSAHGWTPEDVERVRAAKAEERGAFEKRLVLVETD